MVREAAYSGKEIKWKDMQASQTSIFDVSQLSFESTLPKWKVAVPGMHGII
jgi:hypothetical protein